MTRTALVVESGSSILVKNDDIPSVKASSSRRFWGVRERSYTVVNPADLELHEGDTVEIFLPPGRTVISAGITFLLPLALFPVGYSLAGLFPRLFVGGAGAGVETVSEGFSFLVGFTALLLGFPLGALIRRLIGGFSGGFSTAPEIVRVLDDAEALACKIKAGCSGDCGACG